MKNTFATIVLLLLPITAVAAPKAPAPKKPKLVDKITKQQQLDLENDELRVANLNQQIAVQSAIANAKLEGFKEAGGQIIAEHDAKLAKIGMLKTDKIGECVKDTCKVIHATEEKKPEEAKPAETPKAAEAPKAAPHATPPKN